MPEDYYDEESASSPAPAAEAEGRSTKSKDTTAEAKLGLVPASFFKGPVTPGDREMVEVVDVYDDEVSIKCVYGEKEEEEEVPEEPGLSMEPTAPPADEMMT